MTKETKAVNSGQRAAEGSVAFAQRSEEPRTDTKHAKVIALLQRDQGASVAELQEATG